MTQTLIHPCGGQLANLLVPEEARAELKAYASTLPSLQLSERVMCDLELLATGGVFPLGRFIGPADHPPVLHGMRPGRAQLFPPPITMPGETDHSPPLE